MSEVVLYALTLRTNSPPDYGDLVEYRNKRGERFAGRVVSILTPHDSPGTYQVIMTPTDPTEGTKT